MKSRIFLSLKLPLEKLLVLIGLCALPWLQVAAEETLRADQISITTPHYSPTFKEFNPPQGTYTYQVGWQGIPAAEAKITVYKSEGKVFVLASARTYKPIDLLYKLRYRAEGALSESFLPLYVAIDQQENRRKKYHWFEFQKNGLINSISRNNGEEKSLNFNPKNFTLDPFSAAFLARAMEWEVGDERQFDAFNGKSRYLITLTAIEREKKWVKGEERDVLVISPKAVNLAKPQSAQKLRSARIYVSDDERHDILEIQSEVFIGTVKTKLLSFEPPAENFDVRASLKQSLLAENIAKEELERASTSQPQELSIPVTKPARIPKNQ